MEVTINSFLKIPMEYCLMSASFLVQKTGELKNGNF